MSLISCPECGNEVSDSARYCPHCGCPHPGRDQYSQPIPVEKPVTEKKITSTIPIKEEQVKVTNEESPDEVIYRKKTYIYNNEILIRRFMVMIIVLLGIDVVPYLLVRSWDQYNPIKVLVISLCGLAAFGIVPTCLFLGVKLLSKKSENDKISREIILIETSNKETTGNQPKSKSN